MLLCYRLKTNPISSDNIPASAATFATISPQSKPLGPELPRPLEDQGVVDGDVFVYVGPMAPYQIDKEISPLHISRHQEGLGLFGNWTADLDCLQWASLNKLRRPMDGRDGQKY